MNERINESMNRLIDGQDYVLFL